MVGKVSESSNFLKYIGNLTTNNLRIEDISSMGHQVLDKPHQIWPHTMGASVSLTALFKQKTSAKAATQQTQKRHSD